MIRVLVSLREIFTHKRGFAKMIIRIVVENIYSFGDITEFSMIPGREQNLVEHKYKKRKFELLKMAAIYGANGAGKSNLIKIFGLLKQSVLDDRLPLEITKNVFKFQGDRKKGQLIAIEFFSNEKPYYYAIKIKDNVITDEELYESGLGKKQDKLIYERKTNRNNKTTIKFNERIDKNEEVKIIKDVLTKEFTKPNATVLKLLADRENEKFTEIKEVYNWFKNNLKIIYPNSRINALAHRIEKEPELKKYIEDTIKTLDIGINNLQTETQKLDANTIGENSQSKEIIDNFLQKLEDKPDSIVGLRNKELDEIVILKENNEVKVKRLKLIHETLNKNIDFYLGEESDGTKRLLDLIPAFMELLIKDKVVVVDEIERSIHTVLIKELITKYSLNKQTKGQLIFTTHDSNLLDQKIIRRDEVWFAEKNKEGKTKLYSLDEYKEHKTIDIRKGYLGGRYGSIPILGKLHELNWNEYATNN